jgi:hypothetical protein
LHITYEFIGFGAMEVTKPYEFIGFGAMDVTKPYEFIGLGYLKAVWPDFLGCIFEVWPAPGAQESPRS